MVLPGNHGISQQPTEAAMTATARLQGQAKGNRHGLGVLPLLLAPQLQNDRWPSTTCPRKERIAGKFCSHPVHGFASNCPESLEAPSRKGSSS